MAAVTDLHRHLVGWSAHTVGVSLFPCCHLGTLEAKDTPIAVSTWSPQISVSNTILQQRKPGLLEEVADLRTEVGNLYYEPVTSSSVGGKERAEGQLTE